MQERVFDQMAEFIEFFIVRPLFSSVFPWRDNRLHALVFGLFYDGVAVIAFIGQQIIGADVFDQAAGRCAIRRGTLCNKDSERQTLRIHGQMYFRVEPPLVRLIA